MTVTEQISSTEQTAHADATPDGTTAAAPPEGAPDAVTEGVQRYLGTLTGFMGFQALALGHRTGLLAAVRTHPGTAADIAAHAGTHERSTREWLAVLTAAGYVQHDDGVFSMPAGQAALFEGGVLPFDPTVLLELMDVWSRVLPDLDRSVRDGRGIPYAAYQPEFSVGQDAINGPLYEQFLVQEWLPSVDGLTDRLTAGIDVADIGCGGGRALCLMAAAFPASRFVGYDVDDAALALGRDRAERDGLTNVRFEHRDVVSLGVDGGLDLVVATDAIHDQARPLEVVVGVHRALRPGGVFLMIEPTATGDLDEDAQDPMAVINYMTSLGHCVQVSLAQGGPGLGGMWGMAGAMALLGQTPFRGVTHHRSAGDYTVFAARA